MARPCPCQARLAADSDEALSFKARDILSRLAAHTAAPPVSSSDGQLRSRDGNAMGAATTAKPATSSLTGSVVGSILPATVPRGGIFAAATAAVLSTTAAAAAATVRPKLRAITIDMSGLLGDKDVNDAYTHAMLLVPGVTSVSVDGPRSRAVVFSHLQGDEVRPSLLRAIASVSELHAHAQAAAACGSASGGAALSTANAVYLDDEAEAGDDFFGEGAVAERRGRETVEQRLARRRRLAAGTGGAPETSGADENNAAGLMGLAKAAASWIGW